MKRLLMLIVLGCAIVAAGPAFVGTVAAQPPCIDKTPYDDNYCGYPSFADSMCGAYNIGLRCHY